MVIGHVSCPREGRRYIICRGVWAPIIAVIRHAPGTHPESPIHAHLTAVQVVTPRGSRWLGEAYARTVLAEVRWLP